MSFHGASEDVIVLSPGALISNRHMLARIPPLSPASAAVKVGRPRMKACRSEERHRLTTNFHQSSCRQGEEGEARRHLGKWGRGGRGDFSSSEDLPRLIRLPRPALLRVEIRAPALLQRLHNFCPATRGGLLRPEKSEIAAAAATTSF